MSVRAYWYTKFWRQRFEGASYGGWKEAAGDTFKLLLLTSSHLPALTTHEFKSDIEADEVAGSGYTAGGQVLTDKTCVVSNGRLNIGAGTLTWIGSLFSTRYAAIYDAANALSSQQQLTLFVDFGELIDLTNRTFQLTFDAQGNITFSSTPIDTVSPVLVEAFIDKSRLLIRVNEQMHSGFVPIAGAFPVIVNSVSRSVNTVFVSGDGVILTLASAVTSSDTVTVAYIEPTVNALQDLVGNQLSSFLPFQVTNITKIPVADAYAPLFNRGTVNGNAITLFYVDPDPLDEDDDTPDQLDTTSVPAPGDYSVTVSNPSLSVSVTGLAVIGAEVRINLSAPVTATQSATISYTGGVNKVRDLAGNNAVNLINQGLINETPNDTTPPQLASATVNAATLVLTYLETLDGGSTPATTAYSPVVNSLPAGVNSVVVNSQNRTVTLTLAGSVASTDVVTISYTPPGSGKIRDFAGNNAIALVNLPVSNITTPVVLVDNADFISQNVPNLTMNANTIQNVSVTMKNNGTTSWTSQGNYKLVSQNPVNNSNWGLSSVGLPGSVLPGQNVTFNFSIIAPNTAGARNFQWRMSKGSVAFGDTTSNVSISVGVPPPPTGMVGLHFTQAEIDVWRQRIVNGPYKDDWTDRIFPSGDGWRNNPEARWQGCTTAGPITRDMEPSRIRDLGMMDCGFIYLLTGDTRYRDAVKNALLAQSVISGTDLSNQNKWPRTTLIVGATTLNACILFTKWVHSYSYIRASISSSERNTLDAWFFKIGDALEEATHNHVITKSLPNRDVAGSETTGAIQSHSRGFTHSNGSTGQNATFSFSTSWVNIENLNACVFGYLGVLLGNTNLKNRAKQYFKEWLKYAVWSNGSIFDEGRWQTFSPVNPTGAFGYLSVAFSPMVRLADSLARINDQELMNYSTSEGLFGSNGGPKSLLKTLQVCAGLVNGSLTHYAASGATSDPNLRIRHLGPTGNKCTYLWMLQGNVFYKDPAIRAAGLTSIPSGSTNAGGYDNRRGDWGNLPGVRLMFGQMEDFVDPY